MLPSLFIPGKRAAAVRGYGNYRASHHVIVGVFPAQKGRGVFEYTLRILPVPEGDDPLGDVTELHHLRYATSALSRSRHRRIRADARRPRRR